MLERQGHNQMSKLPSKVKIGYREYQIVDWEFLDASAHGRMGEIAHISRRIKIATCHGPVQAAETLLHEIIHGVFYVWCAADQDDEERTTSLLANGLATVWRDNPDVLAWIDEAMSGDAQ